MSCKYSTQTTGPFTQDGERKGEGMVWYGMVPVVLKAEEGGLGRRDGNDNNILEGGRKGLRYV